MFDGRTFDGNRISARYVSEEDLKQAETNGWNQPANGSLPPPPGAHMLRAANRRRHPSRLTVRPACSSQIGSRRVYRCGPHSTGWTNVVHAACVPVLCPVDAQPPPPWLAGMPGFSPLPGGAIPTAFPNVFVPGMPAQQPPAAFASAYPGMAQQAAPAVYSVPPAAATSMPAGPNEGWVKLRGVSFTASKQDFMMFFQVGIVGSIYRRRLA